MNIINLILSHETMLWYLTLFSLVSFISSLFIVPLIIVKLPADYFMQEGREITPSVNLHLSIRVILIVCKNVLGIILLILGIIMLVTPGQGLLCILAGVMFINFPGKRSLQRWLLRHKPLIQSANWLRERCQVEPLQIDQH